ALFGLGGAVVDARSTTFEQHGLRFAPEARTPSFLAPHRSSYAVKLMMSFGGSRGLRARRGVVGSPAATAVEILASVGLATAAIAVLQGTAPAASLGIVYLLAVLMVAIRRGELAALATSVLSVLTLNYLFITPRHGF